MERRNFLKGLVASVSGTSLIVSASRKEIETFGAQRDAPVAMVKKVLVERKDFSFPGYPDRLSYNCYGEAVGEIRSYSVNARLGSITCFNLEGYHLEPQLQPESYRRMYQDNGEG